MSGNLEAKGTLLVLIYHWLQPSSTPTFISWLFPWETVVDAELD